jgi:cell division protein FtsB
LWRKATTRGEPARVARRRPKRSSILLRWLAVGAIVLVALLYARPLRSYLGTKHDLAKRTADVQALKAENRDLQRRLADANTPQVLQREARRLGLVHPGEKLFIVKGISAWVHTRTTINRGG